MRRVEAGLSRSNLVAEYLGTLRPGLAAKESLVALGSLLHSSCDSVPLVPAAPELFDISGQARTDEGNPIANARVELRKEGALLTNTLTDAEGVFTLLNVLPEGHELHAREPLGYELTSHPVVSLDDGRSGPSHCRSGAPRRRREGERDVIGARILASHDEARLLSLIHRAQACHCLPTKAICLSFVSMEECSNA